MGVGWVETVTHVSLPFLSPSIHKYWGGVFVHISTDLYKVCMDHFTDILANEYIGFNTNKGIMIMVYANANHLF